MKIQYNFYNDNAAINFVLLKKNLLKLLGEPLTKTTPAGWVSYLMTGGPGKEWGTNKLHQPEEFGKGLKERRDASSYVLPTSQNPSH